MVPSTKQITDAIISVSQKHGQVKTVRSLTDFLARTHLTHLLPAISLILKKRALQENKQDAISIISATNLTENSLDRITDLAHKEVGSIPKTVSMTVDKSLVGGFVAVYKGKVFDGSVKTMLSSLLNKK